MGSVHRRQPGRRVVWLIGGIIVFGAGSLILATTIQANTGIPDVVEKSASPLQRRAISDGEVTRLEYSDAMDREIECLLHEHPDLTIQGPFWRGRFLEYTVVGGTEDDAWLATSDACALANRALIEATWAELTLPNDDQRAEMGRSLVACLERSGVAAEGKLDGIDLSDPQGVAERLRADLGSPAASACAEENVDYFSVSRNE